MNIRPANLADLPQMLENSLRFINNSPYKDFPYDKDSMTEAFHQMLEDGLCIVADVDGHHLGGVGAVKGPMMFDKNATMAYERFWWVEPDQRAAGVGKALFKAINDAAKKAGCDYLIMLSPSDLRVDAMYEGAGMKPLEHTFWSKL